MRHIWITVAIFALWLSATLLFTSIRIANITSLFYALFATTIVLSYLGFKSHAKHLWVSLSLIIVWFGTSYIILSRANLEVYKLLTAMFLGTIIMAVIGFRAEKKVH